jgi:hypothetical protein
MKLTPKQAEKVEKIKRYLETEIGQSGALIDDCDYTYMFCLKNICVNATGIMIFGSDVHGKSMRDNLLPKEVGNLFIAIKKYDEDFRNFLKEK